MSYLKNPKLVGSDLVDCIPQVGPCPMKCSYCFYNSKGFFTDKKSPLIPPMKETRNKIVRVNSGNDSNNQRDLVIKSTKKYEHKFYNTSVPNFDFPGPVVFTVNGRDTDSSALLVPYRQTNNIMMIRFRANLWNLELLKGVIRYYSPMEIPITITFMRYPHKEAIPIGYRPFYVFQKHILNSYFELPALLRYHEVIQPMRNFYNGLKLDEECYYINSCGVMWSSYCKDCQRCSRTYNNFIGRNHGLEN